MVSVQYNVCMCIKCKRWSIYCKIEVKTWRSDTPVHLHHSGLMAHMLMLISRFPALGFIPLLFTSHDDLPLYLNVNVLMCVIVS